MILLDFTSAPNGKRKVAAAIFATRDEPSGGSFKQLNNLYDHFLKSFITFFT